MTTYLITGAAGFIGSNVVHALVYRGQAVRAIDNLSTGHRKNIEGVIDRIEFVEGSINNESLLRELMSGVDYCLHFAGINSVPRSIDLPVAMNEANVDGSLKVFVASRDAGVKRVIAASSSSVCGTRESGPSDENFPYAPISPYSVSKTAVENYAKVFADIYDMDIAIFRYFNVFGPRQDPNSAYSAVIPLFIKRLLAGQPIVIHGDGAQSRDFTYVENVVAANLLACQYEGQLAGVYNIACGATTSVLELAQELMEITGVRGVPEFTTPRPGDIRFSLADISKAKAIFGYEPAIPLMAGLERTVAWFRDSGGHQ